MSMDEKTGGGATERVRQLSLHLNKLGHDITILTTNYNISKRPTFLPDDIKLISLPCIVPRYYLPFPLFWKVSKAVRNSDIIHLINHWTIINIIAFIFNLFRTINPSNKCMLSSIFLDLLVVSYL